MARKLYTMTWAEVKDEMSIAGSPDKVAKLGDDIMKQVEKELDWTNHAEQTNMILALQRVIAEVKANQKRLEKRTFNNYKK